jgi:hypothetical protein
MREQPLTREQLKRLLTGVERVRHDDGLIEYRWHKGGLASVVLRLGGDPDRRAAEWRRETLQRRR